MGKTIGALILIAAFFFAFYLLLRKKRIQEKKLATATGYRRIFLTAAVSIMSFLAGCSGGKGTDKETGNSIPKTTSSQGTKPAGPETSPVETASIGTEQAWSALAPYWETLAFYSASTSWTDMDKGAKDAEKNVKEHEGLVKQLVADGKLDENTGNLLIDAFEDMMDHLVRAYAGPTCYDMTMEGGFIYDTKDSAVGRIGSLNKLIENETLTPQAADKVKKNIARDLYFMEKIKAVEDEFSGGKDWKLWTEKIREIMKFHESNKHIIAKTDPSYKLADVIIKILTAGKAK